MIDTKLNQIVIKEKSDEEKVYFLENGIIIDGINIVCEVNELIKLDRISNIY